MRKIVLFLRALYGIPSPDKAWLWHKWDLSVPARGIDGNWLFFTVWRRRGPNGWEYKHRDETAEEFYERQW